jgi:hypothetical protein
LYARRTPRRFRGAFRIGCFTSGITWAADYVAEATKAEKTMTLAGAVRVTNNSGEDIETVHLRLVVGVNRLVAEIARLARQGGRKDLVLNGLATNTLFSYDVATNLGPSATR